MPGRLCRRRRSAGGRHQREKAADRGKVLFRLDQNAPLRFSHEIRRFRRCTVSIWMSRARTERGIAALRPFRMADGRCPLRAQEDNNLRFLPSCESPISLLIARRLFRTETIKERAYCSSSAGRTFGSAHFFFLAAQAVFVLLHMRLVYAGCGIIVPHNSLARYIIDSTCEFRYLIPFIFVGAVRYNV